MHSTNNLLSFFDYSNNTILNSLPFFTSAEFFTILFIFNFIQLIVLSAISELIWPTQIFNRQNTIGYNVYRLRTFTETLSKLRNYTTLYKVFAKTFTKFK